MIAQIHNAWAVTPHQPDDRNIGMGLPVQQSDISYAQRLEGNQNLNFQIYISTANKGRGLYSKNIFWAIIAAINQERLLFEINFSQQFLYTQIGDSPKKTG